MTSTEFTTFTLQGAPAGLDFRVDQPTDWVQIPIPQEEHDFSDPLHMAPLAVLMAPYALVVFAVAARPALASGTCAQWLDWMSRQRGLDPGTMEQQALGAMAAVGCWGVQVENGTAVRARLVMTEDGERIVQISCMAPDALWPSVAPVFARMLASFALIAPKGATVPVAPPDLPLAPDSTAAGAPPAAVVADEGRAPAAPAPQPADDPLPLPDEEDAAGLVQTTAAKVALAADQATFDPEHAMNVRMRNGGVGLVPNVLDYHEQELWATLAPAALQATLRVPFGWHVVDDGRRTLVFDAAGHTQISLQLLTRGGRSDDEILDAKLPELRREWPRLRHLRTAVGDLQCLLIRDAAVDGKPIEQAYLLREAPDGMVLQTRVTSSPAHFQKASDLAEVLLRDLQFAAVS
jgi:hypothetical protein